MPVKLLVTILQFIQWPLTSRLKSFSVLELWGQQVSNAIFIDTYTLLHTVVIAKEKERPNCSLEQTFDFEEKLVLKLYPKYNTKMLMGEGGAAGVPVQGGFCLGVSVRETPSYGYMRAVRILLECILVI